MEMRVDSLHCEAVQYEMIKTIEKMDIHENSSKSRCLHWYTIFGVWPPSIVLRSLFTFLFTTQCKCIERGECSKITVENN